MFKIDVETREVDPPLGRRCSSGHVAPETFRREGPGTPALPTRFFRVVGQGTDTTVCEPCYTIASHIAMLKKKHQKGK